MGFTLIEGNIKQQMLPFVLNPNSSLNQNGSGYKYSDAQYFTFRNNPTYMISGKGVLNFCPKTMKDYFDKDISYQLTYKYNKDNKNVPAEQVTFNSILDNIPAIQIREYLPDTALEQGINFFVSLIKQVMGMFGDKGLSIDTKEQKDKDGKVIKTEEQQTDSIFKKLWNVTWFIMKYITGADSSQPGKTATENLPSAASANYKAAFNCTFNENAPHYAQILRFPHMIYYHLQSCTTTGIYELPCIKQDKKLYSSNGAAGWNVDENSGWRFLPKSLQSLPFVGPMLGKMFGNIGISWTPWWDATSGNATEEPQVDITFDLFNDTNEAALYNFIFVNTIVPNNKWLQYGLFQHSSHIYDVKLEGYNRLFACTGQFEVTYDGVLRDPPPNWMAEKGPLAQRLNKNIDAKAFLTSLKNNKLIKIPDIYKVKMTFSSLLPANFNNYLYTLVANDNHIDRSAYWFKTRDESQLAPALTNAFTKLLTGAKAAFTDGQGYVPEDLKIQD